MDAKLQSRDENNVLVSNVVLINRLLIVLVVENPGRKSFQKNFSWKSCLCQ